MRRQTARSRHPRLWNKEPSPTRLTHRGETREKPGRARSEKDTMGVWGEEEISLELAAGRITVRGPVEFASEIDCSSFD